MKTATAIVVGGGLNALGVVRSLGLAGVTVCVLDTELKSPAMRSRYGIPRQVSTLEGAEFISELKRLMPELSPKVVLFLTEEKAVATVSQYRTDLPLSLLIRLPEHERLMALMHKQGFSDLAEAINAPVPRTVRLQNLQDLPKVAHLNYPCVLKPSEKSYEYGARFKKAYKVSSPEEVARLYHEIFPILADMVVQEWIEGQDSDIYFCLQYIGSNGELIASFPGRKIRSWPPRIGGTASCTSAWEYEKELRELTLDFFRQVGFSGMGSMEYKRDIRDGRFYMVEPTVGRTDFQEEVATVNGVNLPIFAYCHELALPVPQLKPTNQPIIWRETQIDRWSKQESGIAEDEAFQQHKVVDAHWRWDDPRPWFDSFFARLLSALRQRVVL